MYKAENFDFQFKTPMISSYFSLKSFFGKFFTFLVKKKVKKTGVNT